MHLPGRDKGGDRGVLITEAPVSLADQQAARRRRYSILMGSRVVALIAAALTFKVSLWLCLALMAAGAILPWCAVLIANDRPPLKAERIARMRGASGERALPATPDADRIIDGSPHDS